MLVDRTLNLSAVDVFAATQDHVFRTILDVDETLGVDPPDVTRTQPTIENRLGRCFGPPPVATDQHRSFEPDFTPLAPGQRLAFRVADLKLHGRDGATGRRRMRHEVFRSILRSVGVRLRHSVAEVGRTLRKALRNLLDEFGRGRRTATADAPQRRRVVLREVRRVNEVPTLRGHAYKVRHALTFDQLQSPLDFPLVHDDELHATGHTAEHYGHAARHMKERDDENECGRIVGVRSSHVADLVEFGPTAEREKRLKHRSMGRHRTLRPPGGAGRVQNRRVVVGTDLNRRERSTRLHQLRPVVDAGG